ncbi:MAG TPA: flagellar motor switch protein FliN [Bryobacteraceae bacterium]|nr:flagellar motor switch protein FliN [Bryobacteraceae bacterium]
MPEAAPDRTLIDAISASLAQAIEGMTGEKPGVAVEAVSGAAAPPPDCAWWRQSFSFSADGSVIVGAPESSWIEIGNNILKSAGIDDGDRESIRSTFSEILSQTFAGATRTLSGHLGSQVTTAPGNAPESAPALSGPTFRLDVSWGAIGPLALVVSLEPAIVAAFDAALKGPGQPATVPDSAIRTLVPPTDEESIRRSRKMELLLDVELPVSVSFGRAQLLLKDVIKLTTGSIIELNRSVSEPVDVIVNNCVIARGEVVVVEGNFGVRVHEVVSRQERLRTLR